MLLRSFSTLGATVLNIFSPLLLVLLLILALQELLLLVLLLLLLLVVVVVPLPPLTQRIPLASVEIGSGIHGAMYFAPETTSETTGAKDVFLTTEKADLGFTPTSITGVVVCIDTGSFKVMD